MKYYLVVGEASGDLHASNLMAEIKKQDPQAEFRYFGGDLMVAQGGTLVKHCREMAYMGFIPVLLHLRTIAANLKLCKADILAYRPDVVILVDYPGFNLSVAKFVKKNSDIPVYYYISPKIWAWKEYRAKTIERYVDEMFLILPFEVDFYDKYDCSVHYVGNPCVDSVTAFRKDYTETFDEFTDANGLNKKRILAILPGSRKQEIKANLPRMLAAVQIYTDNQFVIAGTPGIPPRFYKKNMAGRKAVIVYGKTYPLLAHAQAALVVSGTATLETVLMNVPQAICYYMPFGPIVDLFRKLFIKVPYISLVNLIAEKMVAQELITQEYIIDNIREATNTILYDKKYIKQQLDEYKRVVIRLGDAGASERTATLITTLLKQRVESKVGRGAAL